MPRSVPTDLQELLDNPRVETHSTLDLIYSDASATQRHWATADFTAGGNSYTAYLKKMGDIKQSISTAADRVRVTLYNNDGVVCADVASGLRYFNYAEAVAGRYYSADDTATTHLSELFRGRVMQPEVTENEVTFDIVDALVAAGPVIAARPMTVKCPFRFKDPRTCAYVGAETTCNKMPNSADGCSGRSNTPRFGGWYFPYPLASASPGTGGAPTGGGGGGFGGSGGACFTGETLISMADGTLKAIRDVKIGDAVLCFYHDGAKKCDVVTASTVDDVYVHDDASEVFNFLFEDGTPLNVTGEHPLYVEKGAFLAAEHARLKQNFARLDRNLYGSYGLERNRVQSMRWDNSSYRTGEAFTVYNLHVKDIHTYFANGIAVHNSKELLQ